MKIIRVGTSTGYKSHIPIQKINNIPKFGTLEDGIKFVVKDILKRFDHKNIPVQGWFPDVEAKFINPNITSKAREIVLSVKPSTNLSNNPTGRILKCTAYSKENNHCEQMFTAGPNEKLYQMLKDNSIVDSVKTLIAEAEAKFNGR